MILGRTFQNPNLHLMQLDTPRPEQALYKPKELLEALLESPLFDSERGQWNHYMDKDQELGNSSRYANDQLLYILVLAEFDPKSAKETYERLIDTALYDKERKQWNWYMGEDQELQDSDRSSYNLLLDILVLAEFNSNAAKEAYERLKDTPLYDKDLQQWNWSMNADQQLQNSTRTVFDQLLNILVLAKFNPNAAKEAYKLLKTTPLYDKERKQWNFSMDEDQQLEDSGSHAEDQLLAILVESKLLNLFPPATQLTDETLPLPTVWRGR